MKFKKLVTSEKPIQGLTSYVIPTKVKDVVTGAILIFVS